MFEIFIVVRFVELLTVEIFCVFVFLQMSVCVVCVYCVCVGGLFVCMRVSVVCVCVCVWGCMVCGFVWCVCLRECV